jgi:amino acid transporter
MSMNQRDAWGERLARSLGFWGTVGVAVGTSIGSGIYRVPANVAATLGDPDVMLLAWVAGGVVAVCGALSFAELAGALPRSGGLAAWLLTAYGPMPSFLFAWSELVVLRGAALGAISTIFAEYLGYFAGYGPERVQLVAAGTIVLVGLLNYVGMRTASGVLTPLSAAKYGGILLLGLLAFTAPAAAPAPGSASPTIGISLFATAMIPILWTYDGWGDATFVSGEVKEPGRTLPRAIVTAAGALTAIYVLVNVAYLHLLPPADMAGSRLIAATAADRIPLLGGRGGAIVSAMVMLSTFSGLHASMMTGTRVFFGVADEGLFFRPMARVSPRFGTPSVAIVSATALGVGFVLASDFRQLADRFVLGTWPFYALAVIAVFVLRRRRPGLERPYRVWGYPLVPIVFLAASSWLMINALVTDPLNTGITFGVILAGIPAYQVWRRIRRVAESTAEVHP